MIGCLHKHFRAHVNCDRKVHTGETVPVGYVAEVTVFCADCGEHFVFTGLPVGGNPLVRPNVSGDGEIARIPMRPASEG